MKEVYLITVGKLKNDCLVTKEKEYIKRLGLVNLTVRETKSCKENRDLEADEVLKKIKEISKDKPSHIVLLSENGKKFGDSNYFSSWLFDLLDNLNRKVFFVIGGASGHGKKLIASSDCSISLSSLTFPHKLARLLFVEQIYRAESIYKGHPYHK